MSRRPPVRLTLRGRVVVAVACLLVCGAVSAASAPIIHATELPEPAVSGRVNAQPRVEAREQREPEQQAAPKEAESEGEAAPEVAVVLPGDTLWSFVARHAPSADAYGIIEEVRRLNDLTDHTIHPGQELILP